MRRVLAQFESESSGGWGFGAAGMVALRRRIKPLTADRLRVPSSAAIFARVRPAARPRRTASISAGFQGGGDRGRRHYSSWGESASRAALGNELQIRVNIEGRARRQLHHREPIHARIHLVLREKGPRGPLHSLSSSFLAPTFPASSRTR